LKYKIGDIPLSLNNMDKKPNKYHVYRDALSRIKTQQPSAKNYSAKELETTQKEALEYVDQLISDVARQKKKKEREIEDISVRIKRTKRKIKKSTSFKDEKKKEEKLAKLVKKRTELRRLRKNLVKKEKRWRAVYSRIEREELLLIHRDKFVSEKEPDVTAAAADEDEKNNLFNILFTEDDEKTEDSLLWSEEEEKKSASSSESESASEEEEEISNDMIIELKQQEEEEETEEESLYKKIFPFDQFWEESWTWVWNKKRYLPYETPALYIGKKDNNYLFLTQLKADTKGKKKQLFVVTVIHTVEEFKHASFINELIFKCHDYYLTELYENRRIYAILPDYEFVTHFKKTEPELLEILPAVPEQERKWPLQVQGVQYFNHSLESALMTMLLNRKEKLAVLYFLSLGLAELKRLWGIEYNALSIKNVCIEKHPDINQTYDVYSKERRPPLQSLYRARLQYSSTLTQRSEHSKEMLENDDYRGFSELLPFMGFNSKDLTFLQNLLNAHPLRISFELLQNTLLLLSGKDLY
jgi:hypothetical protein